MNFNRGNESRRHRSAKKLITAKLELKGYSIFPEHKFCDIAAFKNSNGRIEILCLEFETSARTCDTNVMRNIANGAHHCLTIGDNATVKAAIERKFQKKLSAEILTKTSVMTLGEFLGDVGASMRGIDERSNNAMIKEKLKETL